jgi:hypothetical protein
VANTCNPSYSGSRDQEDRGSKPAPANSSMRPYLKKPFSKIGLVEWLKVNTLSSSPSTAKKTKTKTKNKSIGHLWKVLFLDSFLYSNILTFIITSLII